MSYHIESSASTTTSQNAYTRLWTRALFGSEKNDQRRHGLAQTAMKLPEAQELLKNHTDLLSSDGCNRAINTGIQAGLGGAGAGAVLGGGNRSFSRSKK